MSLKRYQHKTTLAILASICMVAVCGCHSVCRQPAYTNVATACSSSRPIISEPYTQCQSMTAPLFAAHHPLMTGRPMILERVGGRIEARLHDNFITQKIAEHEERKLAPPLPRFHPLPTGPVFYPQLNDDPTLEPATLGLFVSEE